MSWTNPQTSLNAVTSPANGTSIDLRKVHTDHAVQWVLQFGSSGDSASVVFRGSLDGTNWYLLGSSSPDPVTGAGGLTQSQVVTVLSKAAQYVRADLLSINSGTATVTGIVTSRE